MLVTCLLVSGCESETPRNEMTALQGRTFDFVMRGQAVRLVLEDCEVFFVPSKGERERVVTTDFYPMISACQREDISSDADYITVFLGRQALGAGGCCATSGTWRSPDGRHWERRMNGRWLTPAEEEAANQREAKAREPVRDKERQR